MTRADILKLIRSDQWMMDVLLVARSANLPDWMIGAGFVRNKIWDYLHDFANKEVPTADIDLIYYDTSNLSEDREKEVDQLLKNKLDINWSVKNQARMHTVHHRAKPYKNTEEALAEWVETATCVAVRLEDDDTITLFAPHGIDDLVNLVVRPTASFLNNLDVFWARIKSKHWEQKWPKLTILIK